MGRGLRRALALALAVVGCAAPAPLAPTAPELDAHGWIERSLAAHGGLERFRAAGGVTIELEGSFDLATRLQGRTLLSEPTPIRERIAIDLVGDSVAYDLRWHNYTNSVQELREVYDAEGRVLFVDRRNGRGGWMPHAPVRDARARYARYVPELLLADALERPETLELLARRPLGHHVTQAVRYGTAAGDAITLYLDAESGLLRAASSDFAMPILGDSQIEWHWFDYVASEGGYEPRGFETRLADTVLKHVALRLAAGVAEPAFAPPEGVRAGSPPEPQPAPERVPFGARPPEVEAVAPGVYLVRNLRPGFHGFFVELDDFVVAVDAPTGWWEVQQIPPMSWSPGDVTSSLGAKLLDAIRATVPAKPVRYLVLTHHHSDHIGGLRPFIAAGATFVAARPAAALARVAAGATFSLQPDLLPAPSELPALHVVSGSRTIGEGPNRIRLIELPEGNPKAEGYLMVHLPERKLLLTTGFIDPLPEAVFPPAESIDLSIWLVDWLDRSGLDVEQHFNVHGQARVQPWHLERIREIARSGHVSSIPD